MTDDPRRQPRKPAGAPARTGPPPAPGAGKGSVILTQGFDAGSLYALRAAVAAHATQAGAPEARTRDVVLAVHELAVNAIRHGAGHGQLVISEHDGALHCQVTDDGTPPPATASTAPQAHKTASPGDPPWPSEPGHGLWMTRQVADHLSVQSGPGGTIATASFTLRPPGQQPAQHSRSDTPPAPGPAQSP